MEGDTVERSEVPARRLFRGIRIALDGRKLLLAVLGLVLTWAGWTALDGMFPASREVTPPVSARLPHLEAVRVSAEPVATAAVTLADPIRLPAAPVAALFQLGGGSARFVHALLATIWALIVWGLIGGAIARSALVQAATGERIGLGAALVFATRKAVPLVMAPLATLAGIGFFGALCGLLGLLYRIPGPVGPTIAGLFAFLPLVAGVVMTMLLGGLAFGWPLMVATVAAENEDTFDALSRSYSYTYQRPAIYALYAALAWALGTGGYLLVVLLFRVVLRLAEWGLAIGAPDDAIAALFGRPGPNPGSMPEMLHSGWVRLATLLTYGWVYSYFWTAAGLIYLLLRQDVDGTALDDINLPAHAADTFAPELDTEEEVSRRGAKTAKEERKEEV